MDTYEDILRGNLECLKYYRTRITYIEARLRLMRGLGDVREQEEDLKETKTRLRAIMVNFETVRGHEGDYVLVRAAVRDMVGEIQRRLRGDMAETEKKATEEALTKWKTELKARNEVKDKERAALQQERVPVDHVPDIEIAAEVVEMMRELLVQVFWLRLDYVD